jgi:hypothetical protein
MGFALNVMVEWLKLLLSFREAPDSNLGPETAILTFFMLFLGPQRRMLV